jgi:hypothetical protein
LPKELERKTFYFELEKYFSSSFNKRLASHLCKTVSIVVIIYNHKVFLTCSVAEANVDRKLPRKTLFGTLSWVTSRLGKIVVIEMVTLVVVM